MTHIQRERTSMADTLGDDDLGLPKGQSRSGGIAASSPLTISDSSLDSQGGPRYSSNSPSNYTYEELHNGFTCPTCQGTGKIPRGREDDLVALIPYNDDRLKPRRTCLYVSLSIFACALIAGILVAFLLPRAITVTQEGSVKTVGSAYNTSETFLQLTLLSKYDVYNDNFVSIDIQSLTVQCSWSDQMIGSNVTWINSTVVGRHDFQFSANVTVTFMEEFIVEHCINPSTSTHSIYVQFTATLQYKLLYQYQQEILTFYKIVDCEPLDLDPYQGL